MGCSPIKAVRELGSERRETVRSLSSVRAGNLRRAFVALKVYKELERMLKVSEIKMSVGKVLASPKHK